MKQLYGFIIIILLFSCNKQSNDFSLAPNPTGQGGSMARFTIAGNYLYTVDRENLKVFDITAPAQPVFVRTVPVGFNIETVFPFKDLLFIGSTTAVHIFSLADPSYPQKLSQAVSTSVLRRCDPVVAKDSVAYATLRANGPCGGTGSVLAVYDITDILHPVEMNSIAIGEPYGLGYADNALYVCDVQQGILVFDISQPYNPSLTNSINGISAIDVIPYNDLLICWTTTGLSLYDIHNRHDPVFIKQIN